LPFLRRRQEDEPAPATPPASAPTAPEVPTAGEPAATPEPQPQPEPQVESQFQLVEGADEMLDMPLGTLIFRAGLIAPQQLEDALAEGLRTGKRLGEVLLGRGWLSEEDLARLLAGQKGLPYADVERVAVDRELAGSMSYEEARNEMALPLVIEFGSPVVAMCDPDENAMERLRGRTGPDTRFVVAAPSALAHLIDEVLGGAPSTTGLLVAPGAPGQPQEVAPQEAAPEEAAQTEPEPASDYAQAPGTGEEVATPAGEPPITPVVAEGEIDYPTLSGYEPIPQLENISAPEEQLPVEVQTGDYGYYEDPTLLEGNAWQAGEPGPDVPEPETPEPVAAEPEEGAYQEPPEEPTYQEPEPELLEPAPEPPVPEEAEVLETGAEGPTSAGPEEPVQPAEEQGTARPEGDLSVTPAWMRGEVNVISGDLADSGTAPAEGAETEGISASEPSETEPPPIESGASAIELEDAHALETEQLPATGEWEEDVVAEEVEPGEDVGSSEESLGEPSPVAGGVEETEAPEYELVLRLSDGDRVPIGGFFTVEEAQVKATDIVKQFTEAEDGNWPFINGRFLRPETIVSIDIEHHGAGWGGSGSRGRMFTGQ
jgi:hypothetical protein